MPPPPEPSRGRRASLERRLAEAFGVMALGLELTGDTFGATVVSRRADDLAKAWNRLAQENATVKRILEGLLTGGAFGEAAMVTLGTIIPILWHRGIVPDQLGVPFAAGVVPESPEVQRHMAAHAPAHAPAPEPPPTRPTPEPTAPEEPAPTEGPPAPGERPAAPGPTPSGGAPPQRDRDGAGEQRRGR